MSQRSFSDLGYSGKPKQGRRNRFLEGIDAITPWTALVEAIEPHDPKGKRGRPLIGLERMLPMHVAQQCFNLSDEGVEDAVYDSQAIRSFAGIDLSWRDAPDATTLLQFRRLVERHNFRQVIFDRINPHLQQRGLLLREGTAVDSTLIVSPTPSSTQ